LKVISQREEQAGRQRNYGYHILGGHMTWKGIVGKGFKPEEFDSYAYQQLHLDNILKVPWHPQFIVLHNTSAPTFAQWHQVPGEQRMANLEHYYRDELKWSAGPHLFIADDLIWAFTPLYTPGVHSPSWNEISYGIELVGDYNVESLTAPLRSNAIIAMSALCKHGNMEIDSLKLHHEDPLTTHKGCPGKNVVKQDFIEGIKAYVQARQ
jgi:hypothetical protein